MVNKNQIITFLLGGQAAGGALFLPVVTFGFFAPSFKPEGLELYFIFWFVCIAWGACRVFRNRISFPVPASNSSFEIKYGDIFDGEGVIVIPVNEYFDGELGQPVSERSLHGQFIERKLGGQSEAFFTLTRNALAKIEPEETGVATSTGRSDRYAIGTVARVDIRDQSYLLSVLTHTNTTTLKAIATVKDLIACLSGVWEGIRNHLGERPVRIPLIGSGLSGVGLPDKILLDIIVTSFIDHTKKGRVAGKVTLVLPRRLRGKLDLTSIKRRWS